jgi:hypothetical protein
MVTSFARKEGRARAGAILAALHGPCEARHGGLISGDMTREEISDGAPSLVTTAMAVQLQLGF